MESAKSVTPWQMCRAASHFLKSNTVASPNDRAFWTACETIYAMIGAADDLRSIITKLHDAKAQDQMLEMERAIRPLVYSIIWCAREYREVVPTTQKRKGASR